MREPGRRRRVLLLHRGGESLRGMERCAISAARAFVDAGYELYVLRNAPVMDEALRPLARAVEAFDFPEIMVDGDHRSLPLLPAARAYRRLSRRLGHWGIDAVYASGGLPCQVGVPAAKRRGVPLLCHFHHPAARRYYLLWLVRWADRVVFPSAFTRAHSRDRAGVDGVVVPNGIDTERFRPREGTHRPLRARLGIPPDAVVVGQVGQLLPHKRPDLLLRTFAPLATSDPRLHLLLVGRGRLLGRLRGLRTRLGMEDRVTLTGYVDDVLPYYRDAMDVVVSASREEGLGLTILEGGACGLPAVACEAGGLPETVVDGRTGFLVPPDRPGELGERIARLARDRELRASMGRAAREMVERHFSRVRYARRMVEELDDLVDPRRR